MGVAGWRTWLLGMVAAMAVIAPAAQAQEDALVIFDFEGDVQDWAIPDWAMTSEDYKAQDLSPSVDFVSSGQGSIQILMDAPGGRWTGAYIERMMHVTDWTPFSGIAADVYLPYNAPKGMKARFILSVGEKWEWTEMNRGLDLVPEQWTTITANLKPGSLDWKFFPDDTFRKDIRKVGIRIEADGLAYRGPVYIDNVRLIK